MTNWAGQCFDLPFFEFQNSAKSRPNLKHENGKFTMAKNEMNKDENPQSLRVSY